MHPTASANIPTDVATLAPPHRGWFIACFLGSFLLVLFALFAVNFAGNAAKVFPSPWRPALFERGWKTRRFDELVASGKAPVVLIMGSSRVMQIRPGYVAAITGEPAFNYGVSVGGPVDFLAQLRHAIEMHATPRHIIVGLDEQSFNALPNIYQIQNFSSWGLFHNLPMREKITIGWSVLQVVTMDTTLRSITALRHPTPAGEVVDDSTEILLGDGYLIYRLRALEKAADNYDVDAAVNPAVHVFHRNVAQTAWDVSRRKVKLFGDFLQLAREHHTKVDVVLLPMHPIFDGPRVVSTKMRDQRELLKTSISAICSENGAVWHDFTHLDSFGGDSEEFWDGVHQTPENLRRMTNVIFGVPPMKQVAKLPTDVELLEHLPPVNTLTTR